jgi:hypothetical protein
MQQLLASYLLNAAWQVPIVALCAFAIARFAGLEPRARNRLWLGFLAVAAILPALPVAALLPHAAPTVTRVPADAPVDAVALAAALAQPWADTVLSGAATVEQLRSNAAAVTIPIDETVRRALGALAETPEQYWQARAALPWN